MKSLTISLDEQVAQWVRAWAARRKTSVSRAVGQLLRERMVQEEGYQTAMKQYLARAPVALKTSGQYPIREELHDRNGLR